LPAPIYEYVPQFVTPAEAARRRRTARAAWAAAAGVAAAGVGLVLLAPLLRAEGWPLLSLAVYKGFAGACHQMPERSFHLRGFPLAVCARCLGLYAGCLAGVVAYPLARGLARTEVPRRAWLLLAAVPTSIDFLLGVTGLWENTHWSRFLTALVLGAAAAFYVVPGVVELASRRARARRQADPAAGPEIEGRRARGGVPETQF
jgi:uncharacterized membrane protein